MDPSSLVSCGVQIRFCSWGGAIQQTVHGPRLRPVLTWGTHLVTLRNSPLCRIIQPTQCASPGDRLSRIPSSRWTCDIFREPRCLVFYFSRLHQERSLPHLHALEIQVWTVRLQSFSLLRIMQLFIVQGFMALLVHPRHSLLWPCLDEKTKAPVPSLSWPLWKNWLHLCWGFRWQQEGLCSKSVVNDALGSSWLQEEMATTPLRQPGLTK